MNMQSKKSFSMMDYDKCRPEECDSENGVCASAAACTHKVMKQIDGLFQPPIIFQDMCLGCWDCIEACPLKAVYIKHMT